MKEQWRQQMQQKMADYRRPAPEVSWEALDKALTKNRQKAKVLPMWKNRVAAAVVALVVVTGGYLALNRYHDEVPAINHKVEPVVSHKTDKPQNIPRQKKDEPFDAQVKRPFVQTSHTQIIAMATPKEEGGVMREEGGRRSEPQETRNPQVTHKTLSVVETPRCQTLDEPSFIHKQTTTDSRLMAKVYLSNGLSGSGSMSEYGDVSAGKNEYYITGNVIGDGKNGSSGGNGIEKDNNGSSGVNGIEEGTNGYFSSKDKEHSGTPDAVRHHQPVRFGLSIRYRLSDRWSVESGLAYTRLRSDFMWGGGAKAEQTLSYIGIPVNANYQLWSSRYVNFYVSGGGMVEKMVKGSLYTTEKEKKQEESVSIHPLQFSVNGGIGAEFNLTHQFSIYAEPGIGYYFDNGSDVPTFYQDKPFSFNLNLGLRFNIK